MKNHNTENNIMDYDETVKADIKRAELGKRHITDIAMTTGNDYTVIDSLMQILELFTVKDADVSVCDLAEDLQGYLFRWTKEYGNAIDGWKDSVLCGTKYKDTPVESSELENLAVKISEVMKNPLTPTNLCNVMSDELSHVTGFADSPEWILGNLKQQSAKE